MRASACWRLRLQCVLYTARMRLGVGYRPGPLRAPGRPRLPSIQRLAAAAQRGAPRKRPDIYAMYVSWL